MGFLAFLQALAICNRESRTMKFSRNISDGRTCTHEDLSKYEDMIGFLAIFCKIDLAIFYSLHTYC